MGWRYWEWGVWLRLTGLAFAATPSLSSARAVTFGLVGGLLTLLAFLSAGDPGWSAVVLGVVAGIAALATMRSSGVSVGWSLLAVWTLVALLIVEEGAELDALLPSLSDRPWPQVWSQPEPYLPICMGVLAASE